MTRAPRYEKRVLAIDPTSRGFGYAVLEGPRLIDWGVKYVPQPRKESCLAALTKLLDQVKPGILVIEDTTASGARRCRRVRDFIARATAIAERLHVRTRKISRHRIYAAFSSENAANKHEIAAVIGQQFPELDPRVPPKRKPWMSEDDRMSIFDAMALALAAISLKNPFKVESTNISAS